ncbi:hypothetical protein ACJX0J_011494, partial [Zea mays]
STQDLKGFHEEHTIKNINKFQLLSKTTKTENIMHVPSLPKQLEGNMHQHYSLQPILQPNQYKGICNINPPLLIYYILYLLHHKTGKNVSEDISQGKQINVDDAIGIHKFADHEEV